MTVSTEISSNEYTGNGVTTDFDYKFRIFKASNLSVTISDADGDNVVTLRLGTDYTVTGVNKSAGGKVILIKPLPEKHQISIARVIPIVQETSFRNQGKFLAETHEDAFDYLTMLMQRVWGSLSLFLKRTSILANWFDAKGYRIANLGKPKLDSDAVDLGTLKGEIEGVNSTILKRERRLLRVDDMDIAVLPKATERAGNVLTFDKDGRPITVAPASGSAVDVLNQLGIGNGSLIGLSKGTLRDAINYFTPEMWGCVGNDATVDNTESMIRMFSEVTSGSVIDFGGKEYRVLDGIDGIPSSLANPEIDNALDFNKCIVVRDKEITLINGTIYPANQAISLDKRYYPTTVSFIDSHVHFDNFTIEGRGENFGDADASKSQSHARRLEFLATNGGHAAYFGRCYVSGDLITRLCGSVSPMYFSSCPIVRMGTTFSNPASLGYAPYAFDAWVGNAADISPTSEFRNSIQNAWAFKESIKRREDNALVGSETYSGKGGIVSEDRGVRVFIDNAYISDQFANGGGMRGKELGYAVGAGSGSSIIVDNLVVRNCQEVAWLSWSVNELSSVKVNNIDAEVRLCGAMVSGGGTYGRGYINFAAGRIHIDGSKVWDGEVEGLSTTSLLASTRTLTNTECHFNINVTGNVNSLITNKVGAMYGAVTFNGGNYETNGYVIRSYGWGASVPNTKKGIIFKPGCRVVDRSDKLDPMIEYTNRDINNVYTYIYHDFMDLFIYSNVSRPFEKYTIQNSTLVELFSIPDLTKSNCYSLAARDARGVASIKVMEVQGLSGSNTRVKVQLLQNSGIKVGNIISTNTSTSRISAVESTYREDSYLLSVVLINGDVRNQLTVGYEYILIC